jgi:hypothetical protein
MNTAARITTVAQGGQVIISQSAQEKVGAMCKVKLLGKFDMPDHPEGKISKTAHHNDSFH